tara:strand:- start:56623 stop:57084 length:462 start_codon:yes stop_codon:yes gene_type:complete
MTALTENLGERLNSILEKNYDAEKGYGKASKKARAKSLISWFNDRTVERHQFVKELKEIIMTLGYPAEKRGSVTGDLHRTWMDLRALFATDTDEALLHEAVRGERAAMQEYQEILGKDDLSPTLKLLLQSHKRQMEKALLLLEELESIEFKRE